MPRRERPAQTTRSEHWLRVAVNKEPVRLNARITELYGWSSTERIQWLSPIEEDHFAEYFDQSFIDRLGLKELRVPLQDFWPNGGPRWDGLGKTASGKIILVEAKAYIEEAVDYRTKASPESRARIESSIERAKIAFTANHDASWNSPFYQYANRLAHLYFLAGLNKLDAYLLFVAFADAPDVPAPSTTEEWRGAYRLMSKCLGLSNGPLRRRVGHLIWSVQDVRPKEG